MAAALSCHRLLVSSILALPLFLSPRVSVVLRLTTRWRLILVPVDAFQKYQSATGGTLDSTTGLLTVSSSQYSSLQTLSFNIGGTSYDLSPNAQIWPRSLNSAIGGSANIIYLVVGDIGSSSGSGLDFIDGYTFLYVLFSFSPSTCTYESTYPFQRALLQRFRYYQWTCRLCHYQLYESRHQLKLCWDFVRFVYDAVEVITTSAIGSRSRSSLGGLFGLCFITL